MTSRTEKVLVPLEDMIDEELATLARDLREQGRAYLNHATELDRYREQRTANTQE
jgi:hypothetical protein